MKVSLFQVMKEEGEESKKSAYLQQFMSERTSLKLKNGMLRQEYLEDFLETDEEIEKGLN
jgi:hypothetical protein